MPSKSKKGGWLSVTTRLFKLSSSIIYSYNAEVKRPVSKITSYHSTLYPETTTFGALPRVSTSFHWKVISFFSPGSSAK